MPCVNISENAGRQVKHAAKNRDEKSAVVVCAKSVVCVFNRGVSVHILNMGLIDKTPTGKLIVHILLAFAEYERDMIVERTQAGKEIARTKNGFRDGRPPIDRKRKDCAVDLILNRHRSYNEVVEMTGLSKSTVTRAVREARAKKILAENSLRDES